MPMIFHEIFVFITSKNPGQYKHNAFDQRTYNWCKLFNVILVLDFSVEYTKQNLFFASRNILIFITV